jgi:hypothetical protein
VLTATGTQTVFTLSETSDDYLNALVIIAGVIQSSGYTIVGTTLTFSSPPPTNNRIVVKFYRNTTQPFMGYLADSYSGALLGMKGLPTQKLNLRTELLQTNVTDDKINSVKYELLQLYKTIDPTYIQYVDSVPDRLEKGLYLIVLYGIHASLTS